VRGVGQVWPVTEVHHGAHSVQADGGIFRQSIDDLNLSHEAPGPPACQQLLLATLNRSVNSS
jgi:hypothetical protein